MPSDAAELTTDIRYELVRLKQFSFINGVLVFRWPIRRELEVNDKIFLLQNKSKIARIGQVIRNNRENGNFQYEFMWFSEKGLKGFDDRFIRNLSSEGEMLIARRIPRIDELGPKLVVLTGVQSQNLLDKPELEAEEGLPLPKLDFNSNGEDLIRWFDAAANLVQAGNLSFGLLVGGLTDSLKVDGLNYKPYFQRFESSIFAGFSNVSIERTNRRVMIVIRGVDINKKGMVYNVREGQINRPGLAEYLKSVVPVAKEITVSVIENGVLVVDDMKVDKLKSLITDGKPVYKMLLTQNEGLTKNRVKEGSLGVCDFLFGGKW
jgi:hypothetical protein